MSPTYELSKTKYGVHVLCMVIIIIRRKRIIIIIISIAHSDLKKAKLR